jgi:hypothetical protein
MGWLAEYGLDDIGVHQLELVPVVVRGRRAGRDPGVIAASSRAFLVSDRAAEQVTARTARPSCLTTRPVSSPSLPVGDAHRGDLMGPRLPAQ